MTARVLRYGELFAGAGGMSLGLERAGLSCAFHAEIADFPRRVLRARWPDAPLYGDVATLNGRELVASHGVIDLLAGGSPCQDMSVAGKRAGLAGARSGLFYEQLRLWEETGATYLLWENVAGALSSNKGKDFAAVLSAIVGAAVAVPRDGWGGDESGGGVAAGPRAVAAWRLLDAQYFGVPQRRLRVFVLGARAGGVDPAEVLLEPEGVRRNPPTRGEARQGTPRDFGFGTLGPCGVADPISASEGKTYTHEGAGNFRLHNVVAFDWQAGGGGNDTSFRGKSRAYIVRAGEYVGALQAVKRDAIVQVVGFSAKDSGVDAAIELAPTLRAGGHDASHANGGVMPAVVAFQPNAGKDARGQAISEDVSPTISGAGGGNMPAVVAFDTTQITHPENRSHSRAGDPCHPLAAAGHAPTIVSVTGEVTHTLTAEGHDATEDGTGCGTPIVFNETGHEKWSAEALSDPLNAHEAKEAHTLVVAPTLDGTQRQQVDGAMTATNGIPRRLMPLECERLMGWPDNWTAVPDDKGKPASDAVRYKACGNGVVSHVAEWIAARLVAMVSA